MLALRLAPAPGLADDIAQQVNLELLAKADIRIDGDRPWDVQVHDPRVYSRLLGDGTIGFGEAYMEGWIDCDRLDRDARGIDSLPTRRESSALGTPLRTEVDKHEEKTKS